jgi:TonB-dependent SusC/RagA subfamily outer membrane receptor
MKTLLAFAFVFFILSGTAYSQEKEQKNDTLAGLVVNHKGKAMKNVRIINSVADDVTTNSKGVFLVVGARRPDTVTLVFSPENIFRMEVKDMNFVKIVIDDRQLLSVSQAKDEIINIGYGSIKKSRQTMSSSSITGEELLKSGESDLVRALAGRLPGVQIAYLSDGTATLRIRGAASMKEENSSPLFVVDGSITDNPSLINLHNVERVDILKDGSIYGSRGANGVVVVTQKQ